nr:hypothetical protein [uncultured Rhodococcus sp.]
MGEILKADLDEIRSLGAQLKVKADELAQVAAPAKASADAVVMPDAGIDDLLGRLTATFETTVAKHSSAVLALSEGATTSAATYDAVEDAFGRQLGSLTRGFGQ